jgi:hypothetical protein
MDLKIFHVVSKTGTWARIIGIVTSSIVGFFMDLAHLTNKLYGV